MKWAEDAAGGPCDCIRFELDADAPREVAHFLRYEGVQVAEGIAWGPRERIAAALVNWPGHIEGWGLKIGERLGLPVRIRRPVRCGGVELPLGRRTLVMGVVNVTPDSFFDGGRYADPARALARAEEMVAEGADIIDVGGESTRPNAEPVPADEEIRRVVPVVAAIASKLKAPVSIDTYKSEVARAALDAGASIVNDISGLHFDPKMADVAARHGAVVIVMHIKGTPKTMQLDPEYRDVVGEVRAYLEEGCSRALAAGVSPDRIWIDPGIGFGKRTEHNLTLLRDLRAFRSMGYPILVGTSNKSVIGNVLKLPITERGEGTAATVAVAVANGAEIVRVHDVLAMRRVCDMTDAIVRGWEEEPKA